MSYPTNLSEFLENYNTDGYLELRYDSASTLITGDFVEPLIVLIEKSGVDFPSTGHEVGAYDEPVAQAVEAFQTLVGISPVNGILGNGTYQALVYYAERMSDVVYDESGEIVEEGTDISTSPHYGTFFRTNNLKTFRRNHQDIVIVFGNNTIRKTIKDVHVRSVTVEVDTSGNPISEIYEFIARDIVESDELADANKYVGIESMAPSDIKYIFNIGETQKEEEGEDELGDVYQPNIYEQNYYQQQRE